MIAENRALITIDQMPTADWRKASRFVHPHRGVVFVEMVPPMEKRGDLFIPIEAMRRAEEGAEARFEDARADFLIAADRCVAARGEGLAAEREAAKQYKTAKLNAQTAKMAINDNDGDQRPDVGVVVAVGLGVDLWPGDVVVVSPVGGTWRWGFQAGDYRPENEIRVYGIYCDETHAGQPEIIPWWLEIFAVMTDLYSIVPKGDQMLVKRDPIVKVEKGVILPDSAHYATNMGRVLSVGPDVENVRIGQRLIYSPYAAVNLVYPGKDPDTAMVREAGVEALLYDEDVMQASA